MRRYLVSALVAVACLALSAVGYSYSTYARWATVPVTFFVNPANLDVPPASALTALRLGMDQWTNAGSAFSFEYGGPASDTATALDRRNVVFFRNASSGSAIATTYSWWDSNDDLLDSDIVFWDASFTFFSGASGCGGSGGAYIEDIATHEFGHALGLGHSNVAGATMFPSYSWCSQSFRTLAPDDLDGVRALYPGSLNTAPVVSITSPSNGASFLAGTSISLAASATDAQDGNVTSQIQWTDNGTAIGTGGALSRVLSLGPHVLVARVTDSGSLEGSATVTVTVTAAGGSRVNVALAANGATAAASSTYNASYPAAAVVNGDRRGAGYGAGGTWSDATGNTFPDSVEVTFAGSRTIDKIDIFAVQDANSAPVEPTAALACVRCGIRDFTVQYWTGTLWQTVPGGVVVGNTLVWRTFTFAAVTTSRIRLLVNGSQKGWSEVAEIEAWTP